MFLDRSDLGHDMSRPRRSCRSSGSGSGHSRAVPARRPRRSGRRRRQLAISSIAWHPLDQQRNFEVTSADAAAQVGPALPVPRDLWPIGLVSRHPIAGIICPANWPLVRAWATGQSTGFQCRWIGDVRHVLHPGPRSHSLFVSPSLPMRRKAAPRPSAQSRSEFLAQSEGPFRGLPTVAHRKPKLSRRRCRSFRSQHLLGADRAESPTDGRSRRASCQ